MSPQMLSWQQILQTINLVYLIHPLRRHLAILYEVVVLFVKYYQQTWHIPVITQCCITKDNVSYIQIYWCRIRPMLFWKLKMTCHFAPIRGLGSTFKTMVWPILLDLLRWFQVTDFQLHESKQDNLFLPISTFLPNLARHYYLIIPLDLLNMSL